AGSLRLTSYEPWCGVCGDPLFAHHPCEVLPPLPQHRFVDMQPPAPVLALGLHDEMYMRVLLMRVQRHDVTVLRTELLPREGLGRHKHFSRGRPGRHGEYDVVHQLD